MSKNKWRLFSLALIGVIGIIAGAVYAASGGETEVRILGLRHDDGRVEVALQQANDDGTWGERIRPEYRVIPADVTGQWLHSSPVTVHVARADDSMMEDSMAEDVMPSEGSRRSCTASFTTARRAIRSGTRSSKPRPAAPWRSV